MNALPTIVIALVGALAMCWSGPLAAAGFVDVLDTPAQMSPLAGRSLLQAVAKAGSRLVAVGQRGHIVYSTDGGTSWQQAKVPVSSDLTAVFFVDEQTGWVVGHDGVILHTIDGAATWTLQLDGKRANERLVEHMQERAAASPTAENKQLVDEAKRYKEQGADKPFLDVWFADANVGYAVGAYNLIVRTRDGGKNWEPMFDRIDNPKFFNLYAIRPVAGDLYVVGEGGLALKLDTSAQRFRAMTVPYNGSFFGIAEAGTAALIFGLRGNAYRSDDRGATWTKVDAGLPASIVGATHAANGATLLADFGGRIVRTSDDGRTFAKVSVKQPMPLTGIADAGDGKLVLVGPRGVIVAELPR